MLQIRTPNQGIEYVQAWKFNLEPPWFKVSNNKGSRKRPMDRVWVFLNQSIACRQSTAAKF